MLRKNFFLMTVTAATMLAACGKARTDGANLLADSFSDKRGDDMTVLQAWIGESLGTGVFGSQKFLDVDHCTVSKTYASSNSGMPSTLVEADCSTEAENVAKLAGADRVSPLINTFHYNYERNDLTQDISTRSGLCELVEIRTITRDAALASPVFNGIGFFFRSGDYADTADQGRFVAKDRLHAVGHVTLKDGSPATVHRFIAKGMCMGTGGNGDSIYHRNFNFRPFAQFKVNEGSDSSYYNVWDNVATDYRLGHSKFPSSAWTKSFDRQNELLKQ